jgi:hypothetical protein
MIKTLQKLESNGTSEAQKEAAREALYFFYAIENRALRNYRHPSPSSSRAASVR